MGSGRPAGVCGCSSCVASLPCWSAGWATCCLGSSKVVTPRAWPRLSRSREWRVTSTWSCAQLWDFFCGFGDSFVCWVWLCKDCYFYDEWQRVTVCVCVCVCVCVWDKVIVCACDKVIVYCVCVRQSDCVCAYVWQSDCVVCVCVTKWLCSVCVYVCVCVTKWLCSVCVIIILSVVVLIMTSSLRLAQVKACDRWSETCEGRRKSRCWGLCDSANMLVWNLLNL